MGYNFVIMYDIFEFLEKSKTAYHAVENLTLTLKEYGFAELKENEKWSIKKGGKKSLVFNRLYGRRKTLV